MLSMIIISSGALAIAIIGCAVIWGMDARRADEIERLTVVGRHALNSSSAAPVQRQLGAPMASPVAIPVAIPVVAERGPNVQR